MPGSRSTRLRTSRTRGSARSESERVRSPRSEAVWTALRPSGTSTSIRIGWTYPATPMRESASSPSPASVPAGHQWREGALPVPLADGRLVRGPRGTLMLEPGSVASGGGAEQVGLDLAPLGLRIVHPDAAHPTLLRLGAAEATPRTVLEDPLTRAAVAQSIDSSDPEPVAKAVLSLVQAASLAPGEAPWLAELALRGTDGELYPAGELMLADGALAGLLEPDTHFGVAAAELVDLRPRVLAAAGVLDGFAVVHDADVLLDQDDCDHDLDGEDEWLEPCSTCCPS